MHIDVHARAHAYVYIYTCTNTYTQMFRSVKLQKLVGNQAASTTAGIWNKQDFIYLMILCSIETKKAPDVEWVVSLLFSHLLSSFYSFL